MTGTCFVYAASTRPLQTILLRSPSSLLSRHLYCNGTSLLSSRSSVQIETWSTTKDDQSTQVIALPTSLSDRSSPVRRRGPLFSLAKQLAQRSRSLTRQTTIVSLLSPPSSSPFIDAIAFTAKHRRLPAARIPKKPLRPASNRLRHDRSTWSAQGSWHRRVSASRAKTLKGDARRKTVSPTPPKHRRRRRPAPPLPEPDLPKQFVLYGLVSINVLIYCELDKAFVAKDYERLLWLYQNFYHNKDNLSEGRLWTLFTSAFTHIGGV